MGCFGLFQDDHETWLCGFFKYLGQCNVCVVKLWRVYECLKIARDRCYSRVEHNMDFKIIVDVYRSEGMRSVNSWRLIYKIRGPFSLDQCMFWSNLDQLNDQVSQVVFWFPHTVHPIIGKHDNNPFSLIVYKVILYFRSIN